jgi:hypothetical protein
MGRRCKEFECLKCEHCQTRVFRNATEVVEWCGRKSIKPNATWIDNVVELGFLRLMWCEVQTDQFCSHGFSPRNASPKYTASILDILKAERDEVIVTNQSKEPFIKGAWDICPYMVT